MVRTVKHSAVIWSGVIGLVVAICGCGGDTAVSPEIRTQPDTTVAAEGTATGVTTAEQPAQGEPARPPDVEGPSETKPAQAGEASAPPVEPVTLALRFLPGQAVTYRFISDEQKSAQWEGAPGTQPTQFKGGRSGNHVEMRFEQDVQSVDPNGQATVGITIQGLKYVNRIHDEVTLDFDSSNEQAQDSPLAALIGQRYRVRLSPKGEVVGPIDAQDARLAVRGASPAEAVARKLLSDDEIKQRHTIAALAALEDDHVRPGQQWSSVKPFSFGMMGGRSYERVYTLRDVTEDNGTRVGVVEMTSIPSAAMAEEMHKRQSASMLSQMFDNTESYEGRLELDLSSGQVRQYAERLWIEWVAVDPAAAPGTQPSVLKMAALQSHQLERIE